MCARCCLFVYKGQIVRKNNFFCYRYIDVPNKALAFYIFGAICIISDSILTVFAKDKSMIFFIIMVQRNRLSTNSDINTFVISIDKEIKVVTDNIGYSAFLDIKDDFIFNTGEYAVFVPVYGIYCSDPYGILHRSF